MKFSTIFFVCPTCKKKYEASPEITPQDIAKNYELYSAYCKNCDNIYYFKIREVLENLYFTQARPIWVHSIQ